MKYSILLLTITSSLALAKTPDYSPAAKKCEMQKMQASSMKGVLEQYLAVCRKYPAKLIFLIEKPKDCPEWKAFLPDNPANRTAVTTGLVYDLKGSIYTLNPKDC